jgi:hypothetical protein
MPDRVGRWVEPPILPEVDAPAPDLIQVPGAQLWRRLNVEAHNKASRGGHTEFVVLARAPLPDGSWAVLAAWQGAWRQPGGRTTGKARFGWVRLLEDRVTPATPPPGLVAREGFEWHGWAQSSQIAEAVRQAAALLPEYLRAAALTPKPAVPDDELP